MTRILFTEVSKYRWLLSSKIITMFIIVNTLGYWIGIGPVATAATMPDRLHTPGVMAQVIPDEPLSPDYEVWINGVKATVYVARVQDAPWEKEKTKLDFGGNYSFTSFDIKGPVNIKIHSLKKNLDQTIFRPDNAKISHFNKTEKDITFSVDKPIQLCIEPDGKNAPLLIFANAIEKSVPGKNDKNVIYYGPGIHKPDSAIIRVGDNQTLYLAEGAIVKAGVELSGNNATICGRGILDGNDFVWGTKNSRHMVTITGNNTVVKDIIIRGASTWTIPIRDCKHTVIDNVKILGGRAQNDDGIDVVNAQQVLINNCFIRTDDDCIALKGMKSGPDAGNVEDIEIKNSIMWCDRARVFLLGHESRAPYMRNLKFHDIDIIHFSMVAFLLEPGEEMKLENVLVQNFRINGEAQDQLIRLKPTVNQYMHTKVPGFINDITFRDITLTGSNGDYKVQLMGADEKHIVSGVKMFNISILDHKLTSGSNNVETGNFVYKVSYK